MTPSLICQTAAASIQVVAQTPHAGLVYEGGRDAEKLQLESFRMVAYSSIGNAPCLAHIYSCHSVN